MMWRYRDLIILKGGAGPLAAVAVLLKYIELTPPEHKTKWIQQAKQIYRIVFTNNLKIS
jgi:hypothetical protein